MAVGLSELEDILPVAGVKLATTYAGIRKKAQDDLVLLELAEGSRVSAVFTRNAFCAAPVQVAQANLAAASPRYLLINAGNANAGTGQRGLGDAHSSCLAVAEHFGVAADAVLPFSTGVIGEYLPMDKLKSAIPALQANLAASHWQSAAKGIMTTDTLPKACSRRITLATGEDVTVTGISKGAGMICPDMATMLAYIATDACVEQDALDALMREAVAESFNSITVDGDTSTNDACVLVATGQAGNTALARGSADLAELAAAVKAVFIQLAQAIVRDAEGASKFISIRVEGGRDREECRQLAYTIAHSPLVKTALFASDPNWGRILAAIGRAGLAELDLSKVGFSLNGVAIVRDGGRDEGYTEAAGAAAMAEPEIELFIQLRRGEAACTVWTCDLGYEYVRINAEYRT